MKLRVKACIGKSWHLQRYAWKKYITTKVYACCAVCGGKVPQDCTIFRMHVRIEHGMNMEEYHEERAGNPTTSRKPIGTCDSGSESDASMTNGETAMEARRASTSSPRLSVAAQTSRDEDPAIARTRATSPSPEDTTTAPPRLPTIKILKGDSEEDGPDVSNACVFKCSDCPLYLRNSWRDMRDHLRKRHRECAAAGSSKRFRAADFVVEAVYHTCQACGEAVLQDNQTIAQHLRSKHDLTLASYTEGRYRLQATPQKFRESAADNDDDDDDDEEEDEDDIVLILSSDDDDDEGDRDGDESGDSR